jgi:hypothetical protein
MGTRLVAARQNHWILALKLSLSLHPGHPAGQGKVSFLSTAELGVALPEGSPEKGGNFSKNSIP